MSALYPIRYVAIALSRYPFANKGWNFLVHCICLYILPRFRRFHKGPLSINFATSYSIIFLPARLRATVLLPDHYCILKRQAKRQLILPYQDSLQNGKQAVCHLILTCQSFYSQLVSLSIFALSSFPALD
jgi:hypothetical protein